MKGFDLWVGRDIESNEITIIQMMIIGKLNVELGGCLHFDIENEEQRQRLAETFKIAAEVLEKPVPKPSPQPKVIKLYRHIDGSMGTLPPGILPPERKLD